MAGKSYVDPLLTRIAKGYRPQTMVNKQILLPYPVSKPTGKIGVYDASNLRIVTTIKAPEGETPTVTMNVSQADAYVLEKHALKSFASDEEAKIQDDPFNVQRDRAELVQDLLEIAQEYGLANYMNTVGNFTNYTTLSGTTQWGGTADAPLTNIETAKGTVADAMNVHEEELTLVIQNKVFSKLISLEEVRVTLGANYSQSMQRVTAEQLAQALGVRQVIITRGLYNSAADGQTDTLASIWGKHAWVVYIPRAPKIKEHCFGYTMQAMEGVSVDKWYDTDRQGWWVRNTDWWDQYVMNEKAVYMIKDAIA